MQANDVILKTREKTTSDIPNHDYHTELQHQNRERIQRTDMQNKEDSQIYHIPTLLNGKTGKKSMKTVSSVVTHVNSATRNKLRQRKVTMIGDSFLRRIRENVELSLSSKVGIFSMFKPGCDLNTLLETANNISGSLTQKDVILICGGSNDFKIGKDGPVIEHIVEFIKTNNHTNIVLTNVPVGYDLSYYSQENKGIRSF